MTDPTKRTSRAWPGRLVCILAGLGLITWALADDTMIGGGFGFGLFQALVAAAGAVTVAAAFLPLRWVQSYLLAFVTVAVSLVVAEAALQHLVRDSFFTAFDYDERLLFRLRPGASQTYTHLPANGGETIVYRVNADGFVGPELLHAGERPRIVVYGDSFIHAEFSRLEDRFTTQLGAELEAMTGQPVEVVNAGVAGYGPDQILRRMETELDSLSPDLVILSLFSGNDFGDLLRNRLYRLDASGNLQENGMTLSPEQARQVALNENELVLRRIFGEVTDRLRGSGGEAQPFDPETWIEEALALHLAEYEEFVVKGNNTAGNFARDPYSADIAFDAAAPSSRYKIDMMEQIVARIAMLAEERSVSLLVMIIPHPMDLLNGNHSSGYVDRSLHPGYDPRRLSSLMEKMAIQSGLPTINLFSDFSDANVQALFLQGGDDHWNAAGQAKAAQVMAEYIAEIELLQRH